MATFATTADVTTRLGITATATQTAQLDALCEDVSEEIALVIGVPLDAIDPVPPVFKGICIAAIVRAFRNPEGLQSESESLGAYSRSRTYQRSVSSVTELTTGEKLSLRRAYYGSNAGAGQMTPAVIEDQRIELNAESSA